MQNSSGVELLIEAIDVFVNIRSFTSSETSGNNSGS